MFFVFDDDKSGQVNANNCMTDNVFLRLKCFFLIFEKSQTTLKHILEINNLAILQKESKLTKKSLDKILRRASQGLFFRFPTYIQLIQLFRLRPKKFRYLCSIFFLFSVIS